MRARAVAHSPQEFDVWVQNQQLAAKAAPPGAPAAEGEALFTAKGCAGCHTIQGVAQGTVGPNLTHLMSRSVFAGAMFDLNAENLSRWLHDPPGVKPGAKMPNLGLSADEIAKLVAYLQTLN
jgi:cytochrome c oxidase subunit 2